METQTMVNATVERIEGNLAIISVGNSRNRFVSPRTTTPETHKKYLIMLRRFMPVSAREGLSIQIHLGKDGIKRASPDLEKTIKDAKLFNEVMDYMRQVAIEN